MQSLGRRARPAPKTPGGLPAGDRGGVSQHDDPAIRLIGLQFAYLLSVDRILDGDEYARLIGHCTARAAERERRAVREAAA